MNWYKKLKFRDFLIKEAITAVHKRLEQDLAEWAAKIGYPPQPAAWNADNPDVLRHDSQKKLLFVGDAKNVATERASRQQTRDRIEKYIREFSRLLAGGVITGGTIAIATNDEGAANEWVKELNGLAEEYDLMSADDSAPAFKIERVKSETFIIYW